MPSFVIQNNCLPPGAYTAEFVGVEATNHADYGDGLKWGWRVIKGPHKGREVFRTTSCGPTPRNVCGRIVASLTGANPRDGLKVDPEDYKGKIYDVIVTETQSGESTRVESIAPAADVPF